jgi:phosphoribosylformylglycinamidine synthase
MAHAEGRFWTRDPEVRTRLRDHVALCYRTPDGAVAEEFPWNPNGSLEAAAGVTNRRGNVLALMPHPERAVLRAQVPESLGAFVDPEPQGPASAQPQGGRPASAEAPGPGTWIFQRLVAEIESR